MRCQGVLIEGLGFGHANLVVRGAAAWIDVTAWPTSTTATAFRLSTATARFGSSSPILNLTRNFSPRTALTDSTASWKARVRDRGRAGRRHRRPSSTSPSRGNARRQSLSDRRRRHPASQATVSGAQPRPGRERRSIARIRARPPGRRGCARALFREVRTRFSPPPPARCFAAEARERGRSSRRRSAARPRRVC